MAADAAELQLQQVAGQTVRERAGEVQASQEEGHSSLPIGAQPCETCPDATSPVATAPTTAAEGEFQQQKVKTVALLQQQREHLPSSPSSDDKATAARPVQGMSGVLWGKCICSSLTCRIVPA